MNVFLYKVTINQKTFILSSRTKYISKKNHDTFVFHFDIIVNLNDHNQVDFDIDYFNTNNNFTNAFFTKQSIIQ